MTRPTLTGTQARGPDHFIVLGASRPDWCAQYLIDSVALPFSFRTDDEPVVVVGSAAFAEAARARMNFSSRTVLSLQDPAEDTRPEDERAAAMAAILRHDPDWFVFEDIVLGEDQAKDTVFRTFQVGKGVVAGNVAANEAELFDTLWERLSFSDDKDRDYLMGGAVPRLQVYFDGVDLTAGFVAWADGTHPAPSGS